MIDKTQLTALPPGQRAELIYRHAQSELAQGLWRAALGDQGKHDHPFAPAGSPTAEPSRLDALLAVLSADISRSPPAVPGSEQPVPVRAMPTVPSVDETTNAALRVEALGPNARFASAIDRAAERTGLPASALACIVDAEAARGRDGSWNIHSRNPRSSAAGLGQFLSKTWEGEAERPGTWLNGEARRRGWLNAAGQVTADARGSLLALRYDPEASIQATADYAHGNLSRLKRAGIPVGNDVDGVARAAYFAHHLGPRDAAKFLNGSLDPARAQRLLVAQVGHAAASRRVAEAADATAAHRQWLNSYVDRRIDPSRFA